MPEPAAGHFRHIDPAGRRDRRKDQRGLVADAAGAVLIRDCAGQIPVHDRTGIAHRHCQLCGLRIGHTGKTDRHEPCGKLIIGDRLRCGHARDELPDLLRCQRNSLFGFADAFPHMKHCHILSSFQL